jgi:hypothetical protein
MKLRWIVEEDGSRRLQVLMPSHYQDHWENVPEIPACDEYDYCHQEQNKRMHER